MTIPMSVLLVAGWQECVPVNSCYGMFLNVQDLQGLLLVNEENHFLQDSCKSKVSFEDFLKYTL